MDVLKKIYQHAKPNLTIMSWMGFLGFPTYYYVWSYMFPQPYETIWLRSLGSFFCAGLIFRSFIFSGPFKKYLYYYYFFTIGFCLPFFFSFMMLMNDWSTVWTMSFMAAIFLHILLLHDTKMVLLQSVIAFLFAYLTARYIIGHHQITIINWDYVPIFLFTYIFGNLFYFRSQISHESKVSIAKSFGAGIAHEMRNPLSALRSSTDLLKSLLPPPPLNGNSEPIVLDPKELDMAYQVLSGVDEVLNSANDTIDLLLTSIDQNRVSTSTFRKHSAQAVMEIALASFSYRSEADRAAVHLNIENDFNFLGSDTLLKYAFYNLLKNAFYYRTSNQFTIDIVIQTQDGRHLISFQDNGIGIDAKHLESIFKDFYTHGKNGGFGLGLSFCHRIMSSFGGEITCTSELGEWTKFTLSFPDYSSTKVAQMKQDLLRTKSMLYIGHHGQASQQIHTQALKKGFKLTIIPLTKAVEYKEYEFEYDLIMVDLEQIDRAWPHLSELERLLHFSIARICYLFDATKQYPLNIERHLAVYPIEIQRLLAEDDAYIIEEILFDLDILAADRNVVPLVHERFERRILIVDDNLSVRKFTTLLLEKQGYEVLQAHDGQEALQTIETEAIDLILMDIEMPILDGIETTKRIRQSGKSYQHIPILGHTGDSQAKTLDQLQAAGMNDYIIKPVEKNLLLDKLSNWI